MKRTSLSFLPLFLSVALFVTNDVSGQVSQPSQAQHLATALDHITVLEFSEPVTLAATGSSAFSIERSDNKVLIKPLKAGVSTDLFVWTASRRFTYELDPPGDVKTMNFAVDSPAAAAKPIPEPRDDQMTKTADMLLTRAFLGADRIENGDIKNEKGRVVVRVESVFQSSNSVYIRYSIRNLADRPYRVLKPAIWEVVPPDATLSLPALRRTQLDSRTAQKLGQIKRNSLVVVSAEIRKEDIRPGEETQGVIVLRQQFEAPTVLQVIFPDAGDHHVSATFVF
jgi:hypothetical protein